MRKRLASVLAVGVTGSAVFTAVHLAAPAGAAFPGRPGRIVFAMGDSPYVSSAIYTVLPDGSGLRRLTGGKGDAAAFSPAWGPRGGRIVYAAYRRSWTMWPDGSHKRRLAMPGGPYADPTWSPDGARIAYVDLGKLPGTGQNNFQVFVYTLATHKSRQLTNFRFSPDYFNDALAPTWSPGGNLITFVRTSGKANTCHPPRTSLFTITPAGTQLHSVAHSNFADAPNWAPGGIRLLDVEHRRSSRCGDSDPYAIAIRRADGSILRRIQTPNVVDSAWSPAGRSIVWSRGSDLCFVHADGTGRRHIQLPGPDVTEVDWQPRPAHS